MKDVVQLFCKRWGWKSSPEAAVSAALNDAFPDLKRMSPPIDVPSLARRRNVVSIKTLPLLVDGTISLTQEGTYLIELNQAQSTARRRFTCAHEIGHTFFMELDEQPADRMRIVDQDLQGLTENKQEEILCNLFAAEILMPHIPFGNAIRIGGISAASIISLSRVFRTSLWSTARRVVERAALELRIDMFVALWQHESALDRYLTTWVVQSPRLKGKFGSLFLDKRTPAYVHFHDKDRFRGRTWLPLGGPISDYLIDALVIKKCAPRRLLTVIVFDRFAERCLDSISASPKESAQLQFFNEGSLFD